MFTPFSLRRKTTMSNFEIIRAWKDEDYLHSLSEEERSLLPENPAGIVELSDEDMEVVAGGACPCRHINTNIPDINIPDIHIPDININININIFGDGDLIFSQVNAAGGVCNL